MYKNLGEVAFDIFRVRSVSYNLESDFYDWVCTNFGYNKVQDITYDEYDGSVEFKDCTDDFIFTQENAEEVFKLGFKRMWVCYSNKPELYFTKGV